MSHTAGKKAPTVTEQSRFEPEMCKSPSSEAGGGGGGGEAGVTCSSLGGPQWWWLVGHCH